MAVTLADLRNRIKRKADMELDPSVSDASYTDWINESRRNLWRLIVSTFSDQVLTPATFTLAGTTSSVSLAALSPALLSLRGVDRQDNDGSWRALDRFSWRERNDSWQYRYRLVGTTLYVIPEGNCAGNYRYWYIPNITLLSLDTDAINVQEEEFDEYIVTDVCAKVFERDELDPSAFLARRKMVEDAIANAGHLKDSGEPNRPFDAFAGDWYRDGWPT